MTDISPLMITFQWLIGFAKMMILLLMLTLYDQDIDLYRSIAATLPHNGLGIITMIISTATAVIYYRGRRLSMLLFSFSFSLMTIISTAMAMSTSMASSTAFYEMPLAQSLTFNQKVAISYMAIIDVIIISSNIYISYQYWMELQDSVGQEEVTNTCLITRKISRQCLIAGCIGLIHYYLNLIFGRQLSNTYLGTNMLVLGNIGIICQRSCNLSFTAVAVEFFAYIIAISGLINSIFIFYTAVITPTWTFYSFGLLILDSAITSFSIFCINSICDRIPTLVNLISWRNMTKIFLENTVLSKVSYFSGLGQLCCGCIIIVQWFIPSVSTAPVLLQLTVPTAIMAIVSFIFGCQQARNSSEKLIINYLIATSVGLVSNLVSLGWLIYTLKAKTEQFKLTCCILLILLTFNQFISVTIIMIKSNILQTPPIEIEAIRKRRG
ncbi:hypothetical protein TrispH2_003683 [Trichoplax sp. H2]|nr:hypothetical protein TrispH2_003683 [Trichoplax sp. H2]|eukprot:RDD43699.1 hypothetical protein TrispH2_003683 [Trichoplax sp. H2]